MTIATAFYRALVFVAIVMGVCVLGSCKSGVIDPQQPPAEVTITASVAGVVLDDAGVPLAGATVSIGTAVTTTNVMGMYMLSNITVPQQRACVIVRRNGYFTSACAAWPQARGTTTVDVRMMRIASTTTFSAGSVASVRAGSAWVELQPNTLVTASGDLYTGTVTAAVRFLDPDTTIGFAQYFSGDASAIRNNGSATQLVSYGVLRVVLTDDAGKPLQLKYGATALLRYPLTERLAALGASSIPLWYFDETSGYWKEEGEASVVGAAYAGYVRHFTDWNVDVPKPRATIQGTVRCASGRPLAHATVTVGQVSAMTDDSGRYQHQVPANTDFTVQVQAAFNDGASSAITAVPQLTEGEVRTVDLLASPCSSIVEGTLVDCADQPTPGFVMITSTKGTKYLATSTGAFSIDVPSGVALTVSALAQNGQAAEDVVVPPIAESDRASLGMLRACGGTQFDYVDLDLGSVDAIDAAYIEQGRTLAVLTPTKVLFFAVGDGSLQRSIDLAGGSSSFTVKSGFGFSADERMMLVNGVNGRAKLYDVATGTEKAMISGFKGSAVLSPDGQSVAAVDSSYRLLTYSVSDGSPLKRIASFGFGNNPICFLDQGRSLLFYNHDPSSLYIFDLERDTTRAWLSSTYMNVQNVIVSPDRSLVSARVREWPLQRAIVQCSLPSLQTVASTHFTSDADMYRVLAIAPSNRAYLTVHEVFPTQTEPLFLRDLDGTAPPRLLSVPKNTTGVVWASFDPSRSNVASILKTGSQSAVIRIWKL